MILETIDNVLYWTICFIFNWTTYFWSIPIWFVVHLAIVKKAKNQVVVGDVLGALVTSLAHPVLYCFIVMTILLSPIIILIALFIAYWKDIENKKIF